VETFFDTMSRLLDGLIWALVGLITAGLVRLTMPRNTVFVLGLLAGVAVGSLYAANTRLSRPTLSTLVVTLSTGLIIATVSVVIVSTRWLPSIWTVTLGYAIGIVATWLLVSGLALDDLGGFAAIAGLLLAVIGGAAGLLVVDDSLLFLAVLFGGLVAGLLVPLSGLVFGFVRSTSGGPQRSKDAERIEPATRFGIEATAIAGLAVGVPFGSRAVALFGSGGLDAFPIGVGCGALYSLGLWAVSGGRSERVSRLRDRFVERVYRLLNRIEDWLDRRRPDGPQQDSESGDGEVQSEETAAADDADSVAAASRLIEGVATDFADRELVIKAAEELENLTATNSGLRDRISTLWIRFSGTLSRETLNAGMALQLSAAEEARQRGDTERAESLTDTALQLAAPTIGSVASAILRGRRNGVDTIFDTLAPLFARIDSLLGEERRPVDDDDPEGFQLIQQLLERLIDEESGEGFDTALSRIRAAAADGWYSVQAGDQALSAGNYQRALVAYLAAIKAYRQAYDIADDSAKTATSKHAQPDDASDTDSSTNEEGGVTASAETYASETSRLGTAIEAICHDTAAAVIAATNDLYGEQPPPTVDTDARRTIVRSLRTLRQTRTRIDAAVPPVDLADDRYQQAEIARSIARLRRHLETADEAATAGNVDAAVDQYERVADRLDVLSNRAGTNGLTDLARSLTKTAVDIAGLAKEPTPEAVTNRPELTVPLPNDRRAPEVAPAGRRLRRTFCAPAFVDLWAFTEAAADHALLDIAGPPYPDLIGSVGIAISGLDPLYTEPDVDSLLQWVSEISLEALSTAVETASKSHSRMVETDPSPPPVFREPPTVLREESAASVSTAEGVAAFSEAWLSRATALVEAKETIERQQSAVDGFAALEPNVRKTLQRDGQLDSSQVNAELLVVAAHHLSGVEYDPDAETLIKTGTISRRTPASPDEEPRTPN